MSLLVLMRVLSGPNFLGRGGGGGIRGIKTQTRGEVRERDVLLPTCRRLKYVMIPPKAT